MQLDNQNTKPVLCEQSAIVEFVILIIENAIIIKSFAEILLYKNELAAII